MKFIFEITVNPGYDPARYAAAWVEASRIIQQAEGARGTYLHRDLNDPDRLLAIAHWESKAARDASDSKNDPRVKEIIATQAEHVNIRLIGEFDEPEWAVEATGTGSVADTDHHKNQAPGSDSSVR